jgi:hypothetical protein
MANESVEVTRKHIRRVGGLLIDFSNVLMQRALDHDRSKFTPEEQGPLDEMQRLVNEQGQVPFGSPEYEERKKILAPMLKHHYENNSHHPEHYSDGVNGMDLYDIVEMFNDWKAASERGEESQMSITQACERYEVSPQLEKIFKNTAVRLGWRYK